MSTLKEMSFSSQNKRAILTIRSPLSSSTWFVECENNSFTASIDDIWQSADWDSRVFTEEYAMLIFQKIEDWGYEKVKFLMTGEK